ncbi:MAG: hypothetical protein ABH986_01450 [archaeon]
MVEATLGAIPLLVIALIIAVIPFFLIKEKRNKIFYGLAFVEGIVLIIILGMYLAQVCS